MRYLARVDLLPLSSRLFICRICWGRLALNRSYWGPIGVTTIKKCKKVISMSLPFWLQSVYSCFLVCFCDKLYYNLSLTYFPVADFHFRSRSVEFQIEARPVLHEMYSWAGKGMRRFQPVLRLREYLIQLRWRTSIVKIKRRINLIVCIASRSQ